MFNFKVNTKDAGLKLIFGVHCQTNLLFSKHDQLLKKIDQNYMRCSESIHFGAHADIF